MDLKLFVNMKAGNELERGTLADFSKGMGKEDLAIRNKYLLVVHIMSSIQMEFLQRIQEILDKGSMYRHEIKHNHKQIKAMVRKNMKNIFDNVSYEAMDTYVENYDNLKGIILDWAGIHEEDGEESSNDEKKQ